MEAEAMDITPTSTTTAAAAVVVPPGTAVPVATFPEGSTEAQGPLAASRTSSEPSSPPLPDFSSPETKLKYILIELKHLIKEVPSGMYCVPSLDSLHRLCCVIFIRQGFYRNATFRFFIDLPPQYPSERPLVYFSSPIFHPNFPPPFHIPDQLLEQHDITPNSQKQQIILGKDDDPTAIAPSPSLLSALSPWIPLSPPPATLFNLDISPIFPKWEAHRHHIWHVLHAVKRLFYQFQELNLPILNPQADLMLKKSPEEYARIAEMSAQWSILDLYNNSDANANNNNAEPNRSSIHFEEFKDSVHSPVLFKITGKKNEAASSGNTWGSFLASSVKSFGSKFLA